MMVGTNKRKAQLMTRMLEGAFDITFAQQFSRTYKAFAFLKDKQHELISAKKNQL